MPFLNEMLNLVNRYLDNHLSSSLTIRHRGNPGLYLKRKLCDFTRPRCHPIFFDMNINSASVVKLNVYQAFLLCAMKFHRCISELSDLFRPRNKYCLKIIERSFRYGFFESFSQLAVVCCINR